MKNYILALLLMVSAPALAGNQMVNIGAAPNDGTGDTLRAAYGKINSNFLNLNLPSVAGGAILYSSGSTIAPASLDTGFSFANGKLTYAPTWSSITNTPTTRVGYGITDALSNTSTITAGSVGGGATATVLGFNATGQITSASTTPSTPAWANITGRPSFATVATSGNYADLSGTPALASVATSGSYNDLQNKPSIPNNTNQLTNGAGFLTGITGSQVNTALGYTPQQILTLTTTGSGPATLAGGALNVPQAPASVSSIAAGTPTSGLSPAYSSPNGNVTTTITGVLNGPSGGNGMVPGLVLNTSTTAAASANATAINAALAQGGKVELACAAPQTRIYISSTLVVPSNTEFKIQPNCIVTASGNMNPMISNAAYTSAWTQIYDNSGVVTNGPLSIIPENSAPTWATSQTIAQGAYTNYQGNLYWAAAGGTTASSGSGPTGTGSGITDGTVTWNYVTTYTNTSYSYPTKFLNDWTMLALVHIPNHGMSIGQQLWLTPVGDTYTGSQPYQWSGTQSAHTAGGPCDSAYFGVFSVVNVNDANYVTVVLRRAPAATFSGIPMLAKLADVNITIDNEGTVDYNYPTNSTGGNSFGTLNGRNLNMVGVTGLTVKAYTAANTYGFSVNLQALERGDVGHIRVIASRADGVKGYGPLFDMTVHDVNGASYTYPQNGDDFVSYNTDDYDGTRVSAVGDVLNVKTDNVVATAGLRVGAWMQHSLLYMDNLEFSRIKSETPGGLAGGGYVSIYNQGGSSYAGGNIGTLFIHDMMYQGGLGYKPAIEIYSPTTVINNLVVRNIDLGTLGPPSTQAVKVDYGTVNKLTVSNVAGTVGTNSTVVYATSQGVIRSASVQDASISFSSPSGSTLMGVGGSGSILQYIALNNVIAGNPVCLIGDNAGARINITGTFATDMTSALICGNSSNTIYAANNYVPSSTGGLINVSTANITPTVWSGGNNNFGLAGWFTNKTSTPTVYGWDIKCSVTAVSRTTGSYCYNTNASPGSGTLTTAGPVMDQGTSANSWFLMANPTGQQY